MEIIFKKSKLSKTDVGKRLAVPTGCLKALPAGFKGKHFVDLKVKHKNSKKPMVFRCSKRKKGKYAKPVFTKGWLQFVRSHGVRTGDRVSLLLEEDTAEFRIEVERKINLLGKVIWASVP